MLRGRACNGHLNPINTDSTGAGAQPAEAQLTNEEVSSAERENVSLGAVGFDPVQMAEHVVCIAACAPLGAVDKPAGVRRIGSHWKWGIKYSTAMLLHMIVLDGAYSFEGDTSCKPDTQLANDRNWP